MIESRTELLAKLPNELRAYFLQFESAISNSNRMLKAGEITVQQYKAFKTLLARADADSPRYR